MRKLVFLSILLLLMSGCSVICPQQKQALLEDEVEFSRAFDHFQLTKMTNELQLFQDVYPESLWAKRAETIIRYAHQLEQQKQQLEALQSSEKMLSTDIEQLREENRQLAEKLEQLKGLLIQLEAQPQ